MICRIYDDIGTLLLLFGVIGMFVSIWLNGWFILKGLLTSVLLMFLGFVIIEGVKNLKGDLK